MAVIVPKKVQIGVRISEKQKETWEVYIKDSDELVTMTGLVRKAVSEKINGRDQPQAQQSPAIARDAEELRDDINRIRKDVR